MRRLALAGTLLALPLLGAWQARAACGYFSPFGADVTQPAQKAFITWEPQEQLESFTVQPRFQGNAGDFGMVIPTPTRPKLTEMPREFFKELSVFTRLKPTPPGKYKRAGVVFDADAGGFGGGGLGGGGFGGSTVQVMEAGVVGSLEYKIVTADRADDLYQWLKENRYSYGGDEETLNAYVRKRWVFSVMRIDPRQVRRSARGNYVGEVTPTRFTFSSSTLVYPLRITQINVPEQTEALFYIQAPAKMDLPGPFSYEYTWMPQYREALNAATPERITPDERTWMEAADKSLSGISQVAEGLRKADPSTQLARLEWAKKITATDIGMLDGTVKFDRPASTVNAVLNLRLLRGHVRQGQWITKIRKVFRRGEMAQDLVFLPARVGGAADESEYVHALP